MAASSSSRASSFDQLDECFEYVTNDMTTMTNEISHLFDQLNLISSVQSNCLIELEHWRKNAHQLIDQLFDKRKQDIEEFVRIERNKQEGQAIRLRDQTTQLIQQSVPKQGELLSIQNAIRSLQQQIKQFDLTRFIPSPLLLTDHSPINQRKSVATNPSTALPTNRSIKLHEPLLSIAVGENSILVVSDNNLCLLNTNLVITKQIPWVSTDLCDIIWSSILLRFLLVTPQEIFLFDPNRMFFEPFPLGENSIISDWLCGTTWNNKLILSTRSRSSSIYEYSLVPSIESLKEYSPPISCKNDQFILDLSSNNSRLILIVTKNLQNSIHLDLCSSTTFERYWSNRLDTLSGRYRIRSCSLNNDQWVVINRNKSELYHISSDGQLLKTETYDPSPCHAVSLQNGTLAILTTDGINLHQLS